MKATQIFKPVAFTTALGVFLVGCGGGPDNTSGQTARVVTPSTSTSSSNVVPVSSGGSGTIGFTANDTIDTVSTDVKALNAKMDQTLAQATAANNNAKKSRSNAAITLGLALGGLGLFAAARTYSAIKAAKAAAPGEKGKDITKAALFGDDSNYVASKVAARTVEPITTEVRSEGSKTRKEVINQGAINQAGIEEVATSQAPIIATTASTSAQVAKVQRDLASAAEFNKAALKASAEKIEALQKELTELKSNVALQATLKDAIAKISDEQSKLSADLKKAASEENQKDISTKVIALSGKVEQLIQQMRVAKQETTPVNTGSEQVQMRDTDTTKPGAASMGIPEDFIGPVQPK